MAEKFSTFVQNRIGSKGRKIALSVIVFFVLFTLIGFFALPPILKSILIKQLSQSIHREVSIRQLTINPYALSLTVKGVSVKERKKSDTFFSCEELYLNLGTLSVLRMAPVLKEIRLTKPFLKIIRNPDLSYNFSDLLETKPETELPRFALNNITIKDGSIDVDDLPKQTKHTVRELKIGIPFLSTISSDVERYVQPHFSARLNGAFYTLEGKSKPFADSHETSFDIQIKELNLPEYLPYLPLKMDLKVLSAVMDTQGKLSFIENKKKEPMLTVSGTVSLKNIIVDDSWNNRLLTLPLFEASLAPSEPLLKRLHLSRISLTSPQIEIRRNEKGALSVQGLLPETGQEGPAAKKTAAPSSPFLLDIDELVIAAGKLSFSDLSKGQPFKTDLDSIEAKVGHLSTGKGQKGTYSLAFKTEAKETVKAEGGFSLDPLGSEGNLEVLGLLLNKYSPFYKDKILFTVDDGRLDVSSRYHYAKGEKEPQFSLSGLSVGLQSLRLKRTGETGDFARIPALSLKNMDLDLQKKEFHIGSLTTDKGEITARRSRNGDLNLRSLFPKEPPPSADAKTATASEKSGTTGKPWLITVRQMGLDNYIVRLEDQTTSVPQKFTLQNLKIKGENISTAKNSRGKLASSLVFNEKGVLSAAGTFNLEPFAADLRTEVKGLEIASFQAYFAKKIKATITGGAVSTTGHLSLNSMEKKGMQVAYKGEAALANFSAVDKLTGNNLIDFQNLSLNEVHLGLSPFSLSVKGVSLNDFYAYVRVSPEGKINLQEIMVPQASKEETPSPVTPEKGGTTPGEDSAAKSIKIEKVTLQNGKLEFVDTYVNPEYTTTLTEIVGRVSGLSSETNTTAEVQLYAKQNEFAPLEISGKINPLSTDLFIDLTARIKDLDLSQATPYSGRYAGYTIEKGILNYEAKYSIDKGKLDSQNIIHLNQFTFGEKVDSPKATKLPVRLAVALLKDRNGVIKLDLPVSGSLDDPKFSVWKIVVQIIVNLVTKAATAPFALLGSVFGGTGEELSYVEFDYGSTVIMEAGHKKLDSITKALQDRPNLHIDIEGHVDKERDKDGLRRLLFDRKVKVQKQNEMARKGTTVIPISEIKIEPAEYPRYLKMAYRQEKFPKPKTLIGLAKDLPVSEMEKLMLANIVVSESDLRTLAAQRAQQVKEAILGSKRVEPNRVFILEPKSLEPEKKAKMRDSRVDFKLK